MSILKKFLVFFIFILSVFFVYQKNTESRYIINLIGTWEGVNKSYSVEKGFRTWNKKTSIIYFNFII